ncbi:MAG TPA: hypothetical protein VGA61_18720 [Anaerolineae bacterium]
MPEATMETTWHGLPAWIVESDTLRCVMVPGRGGKIASLVDRRTGFEWLIGPGDRPVEPLSYGAWWHEQEMSGWDEMFPTIVTCAYPGPGPHQGESLPDHGEAWVLPWAVTEAGNGRLSLCLHGQALPYELTRTADCPEPGTLRLHYRLTNLGDDAMPYVWAAHPQFLCGEAAEVIFPAGVSEVVNTIPASWGWGEPETRYRWPAGTTIDGRAARLDRTAGPDLKRGRKFFALPGVVTGWAALRRSDGHWLRFDWDPKLVPYLGLWVDEGSLNHATVATPEPTTGWYDSLELAWSKGCVETVAAHGEREWELVVTLGDGDLPRS